MKILLINPVARAWSKPNCFPTGLGYIAGALLEEGYDVNIIDLNASRSVGETCLKYVLKNHKYSIIGLTGIITQYSEVKRLSRLCRIYQPNSTIVCGGALATSVPDLLLEKTEINFCVLGEGEVSIKEIVFLSTQTDLSKKKIKFGPKKPITNLNQLPQIPYDRFMVETYASNPIGWLNDRKWIDGDTTLNNKENMPKSMNISGSRGCPHNCIYCYHNYMGQGYRLRSHDDIAKEMKFLGQNYNIEYIHFTDDAFCTSKKYMMDFCTRLIEFYIYSDFKWTIKWSCAGRADIVDEELIKRLVDSGCVGLCYGLESGSQYILDKMKKKVTVGQYAKAIKLNQKYFPYQDYTFIVGCPGETDETVQESINFCKETGIIPSAVFFMTPYPGTPLFNQLLKEDYDFNTLVNDGKMFEAFIEDLEEQGEKITWDCSDALPGKLSEWHDKFIEETGASNKVRH